MGLIITGLLSVNLNSQTMFESNQALSARQKNIIPIAAYTARGDLQNLKQALNSGLDSGLSINEIKEVIVHVYAYSGFPRSIRGLQTFMEVLGERKTRGIRDKMGADASPVPVEETKYERGKKILNELTKAQQNEPLTGYAAFAPVIDTFLKEHLFADIFERDVLTYAERELVTVSVLSAIGGAEPMLRSHLAICLNVGFTPRQLTEFAGIVKSTVGTKEAKAVRFILDDLLNNKELSARINK
jgi:4-carboxymuconolactone decarboxylase